MNSAAEQNQDVYLTIYTVWAILAASAVIILDQNTHILGLAVLVMIVIFSITRLFPYSAAISLLTGSGMYLAVYFSIFPFSFQKLFIPGSVLLIFTATAWLGTFMVKKINSVFGSLNTDLQLLTDLIQYDNETGLLLWQHVRQKMDDELVRSRRYKKSFSLIMLEPANTAYEYLDAERRKETNVAIAKMLKQTCRTNVDIPFYGQYFGVMLPETDVEGAVVFAKRLLANSAHMILLDLRISIASFPNDGVISENLISACEQALQAAVSSEKSIMRYDQLLKPQSLEAGVQSNPELLALNVPLVKEKTFYDNLGPDESLLTFTNFYHLADLSRVQIYLASIAEIDEVNMLEYVGGRLIFKLRSKAALSEKRFSDTEGLDIKAIRMATKSIEIELKE